MIFTEATEGELKCESLWMNCYSCWSYRFNLIADLPLETRAVHLQADLLKVTQFLKSHSQNQCAWNYLTGLV